MHTRIERSAFIGVLLSVLSIAMPARADSVEEFYRGKTVKLLISSTPGAGYDVYARLVARYMANHIPGKPVILPQNMPAAGGRAAANYIYNIAPKDGLALAALNRSVALMRVMREQTFEFDTSRVNWIGSPDFDNSTLATWQTSGVRTIEDAKRTEVTVGTTGDGNSSTYPKVMNGVLGTKFKIVRGYPGGNEINLAMEKGEVGGRGDNAWGSWKSGHPEWLREGKINILVQIGLSKAADLPDVPLLMDLATNDDDHALLKLLSAAPALGHPIVTSPEIPPERVKALRQAFDFTMQDPAFLKEAEKMKRDIYPTSGPDLERITNDIFHTPERVSNKLATIVLSPDAGHN